MKTIRLGCLFCDRNDCDGIDAIPASWFSVEEVQELKASFKEADYEDATGWQTHLGVCPECQEIELWPAETSRVLH